VVGGLGIVGMVSEELAGPEGLRAGNAEREVVVQRLNDAFGEGRLELAELDQRIAQAYAAKTVGELRPLLADLPVRPGTPGRRAAPGAVPAFAAAPHRPPVARVAAGVVRRPAWIRWQYYSWASVVAINAVVWVLVSFGVGHLVYPWPLWVAGPWGVAILAQDVVSRLEHGRR
jgi:hypothetical protein